MFKHPTKSEFATIQAVKFKAAIEGEELSQRTKEIILGPEEQLRNQGYIVRNINNLKDLA
jgi:hypothetical protein